jgi:hypothetical protein
VRPGRHCPICDADPITLAKIESLRETGSSFREIVALVPNFDKFKLQRHFKHLRRATEKVNTLSPLEQSELRLNQLAERCEAQWLAAASNGDGRSALDCLKTAVRLEVDRHSRLLEKQEKLVEADSSDPEKSGAPSVEWLDMTVRKVRESRARDLQNGYVVCPICSFGRVHPKHIVERLQLLKAENNEHSSNPN